MRQRKQVVVVIALNVVLLTACGGKESDAPGETNAGAGAVGGAGEGGAPSMSGGVGAAGGSSGGSGGTVAGTSGGTSGMTSTETGGSGGGAMPGEEMLDPNVDWTAYTLVYPTMYSAFDGVHDFKVPVRVDGATVELSDWLAIPASAVAFDDDPEGDGAMITILEPVEEITIAARSGMIGGTATLHVTIATPEEWEMGNARYSNGVEYDIPELNFEDIFDPNWEAPLPPEELACNNCHTTGAKYLEVQHTPTQIAAYSDEDIVTIFTTGMKPSFAEWVFLPVELMDLYADFHKWESTPEEQKGLIVYLRSLTPTGQGEFVLPEEITGEPMMP